MRIAIVLVNWNGWRDTVECLSSVLASDAADRADIYVVDNDSSDASVERILQWCERPVLATACSALEGVRHAAAVAIPCRVWHANGQPAPADTRTCVTIVPSGANLGFAGGNNVGITAAGLDRYTHFWLLNTDTVIRHDALRHLLDRAAADPTLGMVGSTLLYYAEPDRIQAMGGAELDPRTLVARHIGIGLPLEALPRGAAALRELESRMSYVVGASMLVSAAFIRAVGPMCEDYFLYFEEIDWALRGRPAFRLGYAPLSRVYHKVGGSSEQVVSAFSQRLYYRNRLRFIGRFYADRKWPALAHMGMDVLRHLARGRFVRVRMIVAALWNARQLLRG